MDDKNVRISFTKDGTIWDGFVCSTAQDCLFSNSFWLLTIASLMGAECRFTICYKGEQPVAGAALCIEKKMEGKVVRPLILTPYNGIHIANRETRYAYKNESWQMSLETSIAGYLSRHYNAVTLIHHPSITDIRAFQWLGWKTTVRYTYLLDTSNTNVPLSLDIKRRARLAKSGDICVQPSEDFAQFFKLWQKTHQIQKVSLPLDAPGFKHLVAILLKKNCLKMWAALDKRQGMIAAAIFLLEGKKAYYWLAAHDKGFSQSGCNQFLMSEALNELRGQYETVDLLGADIPSVAYYKSTLGGQLVPHYQVEIASSPRAKILKVAKSFYRNMKNKQKTLQCHR